MDSPGGSIDPVVARLDDGAMHTDTIVHHPPAPSPPPGGRPVLVGRDLTRVWGRGSAARAAVDHVDLALWPGEVVAIVGPSGSGKSTLGAMLAGIDRPTSGSLTAGERRIDRLDDDELARWRAGTVGIVFQDFHLLPTLTAAENVQLALRLRGVRRRDRRRLAIDALAAVGLGDRTGRVPSQLSGGEQQRVGVARALAVRPRILVADEPTGSLDTESGRAVFDLLISARATGTTVVFITHDLGLAAAADRVVTMIDGRIAAVSTNGSAAAAGGAR
jgi:putative ABC transport system ATP-binding protein